MLKLLFPHMYVFLFCLGFVIVGKKFLRSGIVRLEDICILNFNISKSPHKEVAPACSQWEGIWNAESSTLVIYLMWDAALPCGMACKSDEEYVKWNGCICQDILSWWGGGWQPDWPLAVTISGQRRKNWVWFSCLATGRFCRVFAISHWALLSP